MVPARASGTSGLPTQSVSTVTLPLAYARGWNGNPWQALIWQPAELATLWSELLGIEFEARAHEDGREHHIATIAGTQLEIKASAREDGTPTPDALDFGGPHSNVELSFTVDDAGAVQARALQLGFRMHMPVEQQPWGNFGTVLDPEGNRLGLFTPPPTGSH